MGYTFVINFIIISAIALTVDTVKDSVKSHVMAQKV